VGDLFGAAPSRRRAATVLEALTKRDDDRRRIVAEFVALERDVRPARPSRRALRDELKGFLADWSALLSENAAEARPVLDLVLAGQRIGFSPTC
jgi:hypothetical protein